MPDTYLILVLILFALAIVDLVVGVSNDAVNFLNSAVGARVAPRHIIMIVASLGVFIGVGFSSGMMEVTRKGIFNPDYFFFEEVMIIFAAVMITDIILLDLFNTLGLPTSTTVSIVFELLGAAVVVSLIKIAQAGESVNMLSEYINTAQALTIISGIFLSVAIAFTVGTILQYFSRLLFSFQYLKRMKYIGALWSGLALSALTYFLLIKGVKGAAFVPPAAIDWIQANTWTVLAGSFVVWTVVMQVLMTVWKVNILRIIVLFGTFALAMAFADNDLVNFIGVPLAGFDAFSHWSASGLAPGEMTMESLSQPVQTQSPFLIAAGLIMVLTLWFSRKARSVTETEVNLGRQDEGAERFAPNAVSRGIVRASRQIGIAAQAVLPAAWMDAAARNFEELRLNTESGKELDPPAFDLVRASVNLTAASMLISLATSYKLPLSTTYSVAGGFALLIHRFGMWGIAVLLILAGVFIFRSFHFHRKKEQEKEQVLRLDRRQAQMTRAEVHANTLHKVSESLHSVQRAYENALRGLLEEDFERLHIARKDMRELKSQSELLRAQLFTLIRKIEENDAESSRLYLLVYDLEQDLIQSAELVVNACFKHVSNLHSPLKPEQVMDISRIGKKAAKYYQAIQLALRDPDARRFDKVLERKHALLEQIEVQLAAQVKGVKAGQYNANNSHAVFSILLETKDLVAIAARFAKLYYRLPEYKGDAEKVG